jgi:hypothetical protein
MGISQFSGCVMEKLKANVFKGEELLFENITISISSITDHTTSYEDWHCMFEIFVSRDVGPGDLYIIKFEDGRTGNFIVSNISVDFHGSDKIYLVSIGPLE